MPNEPINDEQLDALLRQIETPTDLKAQLRAIANVPLQPTEDPNDDSSDQKVQVETVRTRPTGSQGARRFSGKLMALAASILAIAGFLVWQMLPNQDLPGNNLPLAGNDPPGADRLNEQAEPKNNLATNDDLKTTKQPSDPLIESPSEVGASEMLVESNQELDALIREIELSQLRSKVALLEATPIDTGLSTVEYDSLVFALANQASVNFGGDRVRVLIDMQNVTERYPNTHGAEIAQQYIDTHAVSQQQNN